MSLLVAENVQQVIRDEVKKAGSQLGWAKLIGTRASAVNKVLRGKRLAPRAVLNAVELKKVSAYRYIDPERSGNLLCAADVIEMMKREVQQAGGQSRWARAIGASQPDINNALLGRRLPVKKILEGLGLYRMAAYEKRQMVDDVTRPRQDQNSGADSCRLIKFVPVP
jgi:DNA-binding transcriptional regulator YdaS (Cro superfamily)